MAAEALAVISSVSAVVQLIDFSVKCVSKGVELHRSSDGILDGNAAVEVAVNHLDTLRAKVEVGAVRLKDVALQELCKAVASASSDLSEALAKVKVQGSKTKWKTLRKAIRSVWSKEEILELERRLASFRAELNLHVTVTTRQQLESLGSDVDFHFTKLTDGQKYILDAILQDRSVFDAALQDQSVLIQTVSDEISGKIISSHEATRAEIRIVVADAEAVSHDEHEQTRRELDNIEVEIVNVVHTTSETNEAEHHQTQSQIVALERALRELSDQMALRDQELKAVLEAFQKSKSKTKREQLFERSKIITTALLALETMSRSLKSVLLALQDHTRKMLENVRSTEFWSMTQYARRVVSSQSANTASQHIPRKDFNSEDGSLDGKDGGNPRQYSSHELYFNYFYHRAFSSSHVVDDKAMDGRWKFRTGHSSASKVHREGFVVDENPCNSKCLWFLASLTLALETHLSPESAAFDAVKLALDGPYFTDRQRVGGFACRPPFRPLEEDLAYWSSFAKSRGMCEAMGSEKFDYNALQDLQKADLHNLLRQLLSVVNVREIDNWTLRVRDGPTMPIIKSLCRSGLPLVARRMDEYSLGIIVKLGPATDDYRNPLERIPSQVDHLPNAEILGNHQLLYYSLLEPTA